MNVYDFKVISKNGEEVSLSEYKGKVLLIMNSATECGFTPQYDKLEDLYEAFRDQGLVILDFPCNQFGKQAPGSNDEIASFCESRYGVKFPIFSKIDVKGENASPLFQYLIREKGFGGFDEEHPLAQILKSMMERENPDYACDPNIKWNFTKFLIDRNGNVVERFEPTTDMFYVEGKVKELL